MRSMASTMTLLTHLGADQSGLVRLVEGIDAQSHAYDAFDVIFLVGDTTSNVRRLVELASRRPNVRVRPLADKGDIARAVDEASGSWLLYLGPRLLARAPSLMPQAFERLWTFAATHDCDVVVGRTDSASGCVNDLFLADESRALSLSPTALVDPFVVLYRREFASRHGLIRDIGEAERAIEATAKIGVLGSYPCVVTADDTSSTACGSIVITDTAARWRAGRIVLRVRGSVREVPDRARLCLSIRQPASGENYWLPVEERRSDDGSFRGSVAIDVRTAALGERLSTGVWHVDVGVHGQGNRWTARAPLPPTDLNPAIIDGVLLGPTRLGDAFALDIGARRSPAITKFAASDVVIEETAAGTLMTATLSGLFLEGTSTTPGFLWLDGFRLRAALVVSDDQAKMTCLLSGSAGTSALSTQFGSAKPMATGLSLGISSTGHMSVFPTPQGSPTKNRGAATTDGAPGRNAPSYGRIGHGRRPLVTRLRRNVPGPLKPAVRVVARSELAKMLYRRLSNRRTARD
jgi:hypothetical protein